jgi:hypothetical protein
MNDSREALYRRRFFILQALRIGGAGLGFLGLAIVAGKLTDAGGHPLPPVLGYAIVALAIIDVMLMPGLLIRYWRRKP